MVVTSAENEISCKNKIVVCVIGNSPGEHFCLTGIMNICVCKN